LYSSGRRRNLTEGLSKNSSFFHSLSDPREQFLSEILGLFPNIRTGDVSTLNLEQGSITACTVIASQLRINYCKEVVVLRLLYF